MLVWHKLDGKLIGFTYYPLLQIFLGAFLVFCALLVPGFYFYINGYKNSNITESIICIIFLIFFSWLGKNLALQWFDATLSTSDLIIDNTISVPKIKFKSSINSITKLTIKEFSNELANNQFSLIIHYKVEEENKQSENHANQMANTNLLSTTDISHQQTQNKINNNLFEVIIHKSICLKEVEEIKVSIEKLLNIRNN